MYEVTCSSVYNVKVYIYSFYIKLYVYDFIYKKVCGYIETYLHGYKTVAQLYRIQSLSLQDDSN